MREWGRVKLRDLYEVHNGLSKSRKFFGHGHPFLTFSTVFNHFFLPGNLGSSVESTPEEQLSFSIKRGDVFITRTSETAEELGMSAVALIDYPQATYNGFCKRLRPISDCRILPEYAGYVLRAPEFRTRFYGLAGSMTSRASLRNDDLLEMDIPLPELSVQRKVSKCLFDYDSAIDNARRQIALLEEAAMRLYREWFIVHADPKWEKRRLGELIETIESGSRPRGGALKAGIPSIGAEKVNGVGIYDFTNEKYISEEFFRKMRRGVVKDNDVLLYKDGAYAGKVSMIVDGFPHTHAAINEHVFLLRTKEDLAQHYLYALLRQQDSYTYYNTVASAKAAQPGLNQDDVLDFEIWFPAVTTIEKYEQEVEPLFHCIGSKANKIKQLTEARDRLLPKLMSGEIEV